MGVHVRGSRGIDVDASPDEGFGLAEDQPPFDGDAHRHDKHQLLYAHAGSMSLAVADRRWLLSPQRAAFIPAGTVHAVRSATGIALRTVYLDRALLADPPRGCTVFAVPPLAREMILHAMRWPPGGPRPGRDPTRAAFFHALALLAVEWSREGRPFSLPRANSTELARAMTWIEENLADATIEGAAKAAGLSVRTLTRRFTEEAQTSFRAHLRGARLMRAMELLAEPRASVSATAFVVGFGSPAAFATAFQETCGESPSDYRARVSGAPPLTARSPRARRTRG